MKLRVDVVLFTAGVFALFLSDPLSAAENKSQWQTGHLISTDLSGHGPKTEGKRTGSSKRTDVWWVYCISTGQRNYSVVSRESPTKAGLKVGGAVRFSVQSNRMIIPNPKGEHRAFRIVRQGTGNLCR
jgi:hypothetical protein